MSVFFQTSFHQSFFCFCFMLKESKFTGKNRASKVPTLVRLYHLINPVEFFSSLGTHKESQTWGFYVEI